MFDLVNAPDVIAAMKGGSDATPRIQELGPYYYAVKWNYTDFEWSWDLNSLNFTSREELVFCGGVDGIPGRTSEDDLVTNINLAYQAAKATGREDLNALWQTSSDDKWVIKRPVRDWVRGYDDEQLKRGIDSGIVRSARVPGLQHNLSIPTPTDHTSPGDGRQLPDSKMTIYTRAQQQMVGYLSQVQNKAHAQRCYRFAPPSGNAGCEDAWPSCVASPDDPESPNCPDWPSAHAASVSSVGYIQGSVGTRFPPASSCNRPLSLWLPSILRTVRLVCNASVGFVQVTGSDTTVPTRLFHIAEADVAPESEVAANQYYDMDSWGSPWLFNMSASRGAPIFISLPYFANSNMSWNESGGGGSSLSNVTGPGMLGDVQHQVIDLHIDVSVCASAQFLAEHGWPVVAHMFAVPVDSAAHHRHAAGRLHTAPD